MLPQAASRPNKRRSGQSSTILTDSPYKRFLQSKSPVTTARKQMRVSELQTGSKRPAQTAAKPKHKSKRGTKKTVVESSDDDDDEEWPRLVCCEPYKNSKKGEKWIRCVSCECWAHVLCTGLDSKAMSE